MTFNFFLKKFFQENLILKGIVAFIVSFSMLFYFYTTPLFSSKYKTESNFYGDIQIEDKNNYNLDTLFQTLSQKTDIFLSQRYHLDAFANFKDKTSKTTIIGIEPEAEKNISKFWQKIKKRGRYLNKEDFDQITISEALAKELMIETEDEISILTYTDKLNLNSKLFTVVGILEGEKELQERNIILLNITAFSDIFGKEAKKTIVIKLKQNQDFKTFKNQLKSQYPLEYNNIIIKDLKKKIKSDKFIFFEFFNLYIKHFSFWILIFALLFTFNLILYLKRKTFSLDDYPNSLSLFFHIFSKNIFLIIFSFLIFIIFFFISNFILVFANEGIKAFKLGALSFLIANIEGLILSYFFFKVQKGKE